MNPFFRYITVRNWLLLTVFLCSSAQLATAQLSVRSRLIKPNAQEALSYSSFADSLIAGDTIQVQEATKSPSLAILLSAVLPGAGQIYTERYWTVPIVVGFSAYFVTQLIRMNDRYLTARDKYRSSVESGENGGQGDSYLLYVRDFYRDERDKFAFYLALTYLLNLVDAYVGASLYNFEVSDNLGGGAALKVSVPIR